MALLPSIYIFFQFAKYFSNYLANTYRRVESVALVLVKDPSSLTGNVLFVDVALTFSSTLVSDPEFFLQYLFSQARDAVEADIFPLPQGLAVATIAHDFLYKGKVTTPHTNT